MTSSRGSRSSYPTEQFVVITRLCEGHRVLLDDELLDYLGERRVDLEERAEGLLESGLVAMAGHEIELITNRYQTAMLPNGRLIAGEDSTGRLTRWIARCLEDR